MIYIKNADTISHTYSGQTITAGQYHMIETFDLRKWQNDSILLKDIANSIAVVAKSNDSLTDIADVNDAIDCLKQFNQVQKTETAEDIPAGGATNTFDGFQFTALKGVETTFDHKFTLDFLLHKGELETQSDHFKDYINMEVVDVDGIVYPAGTVMKKYINNYPVDSSGKTNFDTNKKTVLNLKNFYIRIKYKSVGTVDVDCKVRMRGFDS